MFRPADRPRTRVLARGVDFPEVDIAEVWENALVFAARGWIAARASTRTPCVEFEVRTNPIWPMPGLLPALEGLLRGGKTLGLVSNAQFYTPQALWALLGRSVEQLGFAADLQFYSYQYRRAKPSAELYRLAAAALQRRGIPAGRALYVGNDMRNDVAPAARLGFRTALFAGDARSLRADGRSVCMRRDLAVTDLGTPRLRLICNLSALERTVMGRRIGFVSTRFAGTDGVSESAKGAGLVALPAFSFGMGAVNATRTPACSSRGLLAYPTTSDQLSAFALDAGCRKSRGGSYEQSEHLKNTLYGSSSDRDRHPDRRERPLHPDARAVRGADAFHHRNRTPTIAHHHDFYWERTRFSVNAINDIRHTFPPTSTAIRRRSTRCRRSSWRWQGRFLDPDSQRPRFRAAAPTRRLRLRIRNDLGLAPTTSSSCSRRGRASEGIEH